MTIPRHGVPRNSADTSRPASAAAALCALCLSGCVTSAHLSIGPSVDSSGNPGFDVILSGGIGLGTEDHGVLLDGYIGGGLGGEGADGVLMGGVELSAEVGGESGAVGGRVALGYANRRLFRAGGQQVLNGLGLRGGLTYAFEKRYNIGFGARMELLWGDELRAWASFPVSLGLFMAPGR